MKKKEETKLADSREADSRGKKEKVSVGSRIVSRSAGDVVRQYPPEVGHHGTDEEKDLNPEE